ncbi:hypothetical protein K438DRAFT_1753657 [Mycena galopus ATCC 62051]|nr:hypothetical protein K438DRAFT_1753657 [Mycena galopus ATCC 62051]
MSGTGVTYYDEELKHLFCLLKALPDVIPSGDAYDFTGYVHDPEKCEAGLAVLNAADSNHAGEVNSISFAAETIANSRDGVDITVPFFKDLLADSPVEGANAIRSLADWSGGGVRSGGNAKKATGSTAWDGETAKLVF